MLTSRKKNITKQFVRGSTNRVIIIIDTSFILFIHFIFMLRSSLSLVSIMHIVQFIIHNHSIVQFQGGRKMDPTMLANCK